MTSSRTAMPSVPAPAPDNARAPAGRGRAPHGRRCRPTRRSAPSPRSCRRRRRRSKRIAGLHRHRSELRRRRRRPSRASCARARTAGRRCGLRPDEADPSELVVAVGERDPAGGSSRTMPVTFSMSNGMRRRGGTCTAGGVRHLAVLQMEAGAREDSKSPTWSWRMWVMITLSIRAASLSSAAEALARLRMTVRSPRPVSS